MKKKRALGITLIAIGKLVKALVLVTAGVTALVMAKRGPPQTLLRLADLLRVDSENRFLHHALGAVTGVSTRRLHEVGIGTFVYAALFTVEAIGLWLQKRWGEWFTLGITISFLPLEIYELAHHASVAKAVTLVLNLVVVAYIAARLRKKKQD